MEDFVSIVYGTTAFNCNCKVKLISNDFVSPSDEALAVLLLENSYEHYSKRARNELENKAFDMDSLPERAYVEKRKNRSPGGWTAEGYRRYCYIHQLVLDDRKEGYAEQVEERFRGERRSKSKKMSKTASKLLAVKVPNDL